MHAGSLQLYAWLTIYRDHGVGNRVSTRLYQAAYVRLRGSAHSVYMIGGQVQDQWLENFPCHW